MTSTTTARIVLLHLHVEVPEEDDRNADKIADAIEAALEVGSDDDSVKNLEVIITLAEEV